MKRKVILSLLIVLFFGVGILISIQHYNPLRDYLLGRFSPADTQKNEDQSKHITLPPIDQTIPSPPKQEEEPKTQPNQIDPEDSFTIRGVIEGFYGSPWTTEQRTDMLAFMGLNRMNTYVYAPKDDHFQRANWGELYPSGQLQQMKSLVQKAKANGINFVYSISPGIPSPLPGETLTPTKVANSISFTSKKDVQRLESKIDQLRSIGISTFMLSFDDVEHYLKSSDQQVYGSDYPKAHIDLANRLVKDETAKDQSFALWLAPTDYYGLNDSSYWSAIRSDLDSSVQVIWTGKWVLNQSITSNQAEQVGKLLGKKPLVWDNYPVNDYTYVVKKAPQLLMGPLVNRAEDLSSYTSGMLANPMLQPEASKVALYTVAQYLYNPSSYDSVHTWDEAIRNIPGIGDVSAFRRFCQYSSQSTLITSDDTGFGNLESAFWQEYKSPMQESNESALRKELEALSMLPDNLEQTIYNQELLSEINPWVLKLGEEGQIGLQALTYLNLSENDPQKLNVKNELQTSLQKLKSNNLEIGSQVMSFIEKASSK